MPRHRLARLLPVLLLSACARQGIGDTAAVVGDVPAATAVVAELVPTVVTVTWTEEVDGDVGVEFGPTEAYGSVAWPHPLRPGSAPLVGSAPMSDVHWRIVVDRDGERIVGEDHVVRTGARPEDLPVLSLAAPTADDWEGFLLVSAFDAIHGVSAVLLLDGEGEVVWWQESSLFVPSARLSRDGAVLFRTDSVGDDGRDGGIWSVDWTGERLNVRAHDDAGHHDFVELEDGTLAALDAEVSTWNGEPIVGDRIVEYHPDGTSREVWSAFDALVPAIDEEKATYTREGLDWTHANGLDYDPVTGRYLVSLYGLSSLVAVDAATGETAWTLGRDGSTYAFVDDPGFGPQHAPSFVDGGVLLFDNHNPTGKEDDPVRASRAVRYDLDAETGLAHPVWHWTPQADLTNGILGDALLLDDASVLVSDGIGGALQVVGEDGELRLSFKAPPGWMFGRGVALDGALRPR